MQFSLLLYAIAPLGCRFKGDAKRNYHSGSSLGWDVGILCGNGEASKALIPAVHAT